MPYGTQAHIDTTAQCMRCNGAGRIGQYARIAGGRCFACNGTGRVAATSQYAPEGTQAAAPAFVAPAYTGPVDGTTPRGERSWQAFKGAYPAEAAWLASMASGDFGASLIRAIRRYGNLTPRQLAAVQRKVTTAGTVALANAHLDGVTVDSQGQPVAVSVPVAESQAERNQYYIGWLRARLSAGDTTLTTPDGGTASTADVLRAMENRGLSYSEAVRNYLHSETVRDSLATMARAAGIAPTPVTIDMSRIFTAFDAASASGLIKVRLTLGNVEFRLIKARPGYSLRVPAHAGHVQCYLDGSYYGRVDRNNVFHARAGLLSHNAPQGLDVILSRFRTAAADPQAAARTHGQDTGNCSCCRRPLSDPPSVMAGIGPVCITRFGWSF